MASVTDSNITNDKPQYQTSQNGSHCRHRRRLSLLLDTVNFVKHRQRRTLSLGVSNLNRVVGDEPMYPMFYDTIAERISGALDDKFLTQSEARSEACFKTHLPLG